MEEQLLSGFVFDWLIGDLSHGSPIQNYFTLSLRIWFVGSIPSLAPILTPIPIPMFPCQPSRQTHDSDFRWSLARIYFLKYVRWWTVV